MQQRLNRSTESGRDDRQRHLSIRLLGTFELTTEDDTALDVGSRKAQALLAYLAVTQMPVPRATLTLLLWPEMDERAAKNNLRTTLTVLNRQLAPYLAITTTAVAFQRHLPYSLDVEAFCNRVDAAITTQDVAALEAAAALYRGEFLQGFHLRNADVFEEWLLHQRERLHLLFVRALETLVTLSLERGEYTAGLQAGRRLLTIEPWLESAHRHVMQMLALSGERAKALRQYEHCCQLLATELGVEPSAETLDLYTQIQNGSLRPPTTPLHPHPHPVAAFPPLPQAPTVKIVAATPTIPHNLHTPLTAFIGRQKELAFIEQRLCAPDCRLLTIVGLGGMGKSRLALEVGLRLRHSQHTAFPDGIFFVPLTDIHPANQDDRSEVVTTDATTGETILRAIAEHLDTQSGIRLSSSQQLHAYLRTRRLLLILDNFEHLLTGVQTIVTLLTQAPQVKVLITSRSRLHVRGEQLLPLDKLSLPPARDSADRHGAQVHEVDVDNEVAWQASEALAMFVQRAQLLDPGFALNRETSGPVARICQLVEGLPLGIELATNMLPLLSCEELAAELAEGLDFLAAGIRDLPDEQRTLATVFERSWRLLSPESQQLLARLAIFPGSFHRDAAEAITDALPATLNRLLDHSLVSRVGRDRYILHRVLHLFARQKLQQWPAQVETLQLRYAHFYLKFLGGFERKLTGSEYRSAAQQIVADLDNIHTAWRWGLTHELYSELYHSLGPLYLIYEQYGFYLDIYALLKHALSHFEQPEPLSKKGQGNSEVESTRNQFIGLLQTYFAWSNLRTGQLAQTEALYEAAWSRLKGLNSPAAALCLGFWGAWKKVDSLRQSAALLTECIQLAQKHGLHWIKAVAQQTLGETNLLFGQYDEAEAQVAAGFAVAIKMQWPRPICSGYKIRGRIHLLRGSYREAEALLQEAIALTRQHHFHVLYIDSMLTLGEVYRLQDRFAEAKACFAECRKFAESLGIAAMFTSAILWEEGSLAEQCHEYTTAKACFTQSLALGLPNWWAHALPTLGWALIGIGDIEAAQTYFQKAWTTAEAQERYAVSLDAQAGLAYTAALRANLAHQEDATHRATVTESIVRLRQVYQHPAATQQTRDRIARIIQELGVAEFGGAPASPAAGQDQPAGISGAGRL